MFLWLVIVSSSGKEALAGVLEPGSPWARWFKNQAIPLFPLVPGPVTAQVTSVQFYP